MTLSSLSSTPSPSLATQEASLPAPSHTGKAPADTRHAPDGMPVSRRAGQPGPAAPRPPRAAAPHTGTPAATATVPTGEQDRRKPDKFGKELALAAFNYKALEQTVQEVKHAADQYHVRYMNTGNRQHKAAAQTLAIEHGVLKGLYMIRLLHKDWLSQTPVVNPASLAYVLPLFDHALGLCKNQSDAVTFPITGHGEALKRLQQQVIASQQSLQAGQWQATAEGQWYAQRRGTAPAAHPDNPFTGLQVACRKLEHVLGQLLHTLDPEPAAPTPTPAETPAQATGPQGLAVPHAAGPRSFLSVLSMGLLASSSAGETRRHTVRPTPRVATKPQPAPHRTPGPVTDPRATRRTPAPRGPVHPQATRVTRAPAVPHRAAPALPPVKTRPSHQATAAPSAATTATPPSPPSPLASPTSPPALAPADDRALSSPAATVAEPLPVDPAAEAAEQLRQERLADLRTTLAPLQAEARRLGNAAQADAAADTPTGRPWDRFAREFTAWQAVVAAHDVCSTTLAAEAAAVFGADSEDPDVRRMQRDIDAASRQALDCAGQAADNTLAAFAQTCHTAIVEGKLEKAGIDSYNQLAAICCDLQQKWQEAPLRSRLSELEGRMAQYKAYEMACRARDNDQATKVPVPKKAELLDEAAALSRRAFAGARSALDDRLRAFHKACTSGRSDILEAAVCHEINAIHDFRVEQGASLAPVLLRGEEIAAAFNTLLIGDPLPQAGTPAAANKPRPPQRESDDFLVQDAYETIEAARAQRAQAIELPALDVPLRAVHEQQAGWAVLSDMELTARTAANALECFHALSEALGTTPPVGRPAIVRDHATTLKQHESDLLKALLDHQHFAGKVREPALLGLLEASQTRLRADLRTTQRMHLALAAQAQLLEERLSANEVRSRIDPSRPADLPRPDLSGSAHDTIAEVLNTGMKSVEHQRRKEKGKIKNEAWQAESRLHDQLASSMQERIACEKVLIQGQLLVALAATAREPDSSTLPLAQVAVVLEQIAKRDSALVADNRKHKERAASSEHEDLCKAQIAANNDLRRSLVTLKLKLSPLSPGLAEAPASGSSQADEPAAQAAQKAQPSKPSRRHKHR